VAAPLVLPEDARYRKYAEEFGHENWELDALEPTVLGQLVRDEVDAILDHDRWDAAVAREQAGAGGSRPSRSDGLRWRRWLGESARHDRARRVMVIPSLCSTARGCSVGSSSIAGRSPTGRVCTMHFRFEVDGYPGRVQLNHPT